MTEVKPAARLDPVSSCAAKPWASWEAGVGWGRGWAWRPLHGLAWGKSRHGAAWPPGGSGPRQPSPKQEENFNLWARCSRKNCVYIASHSAPYVRLLSTHLNRQLPLEDILTINCRGRSMEGKILKIFNKICWVWVWTRCSLSCVLCTWEWGLGVLCTLGALCLVCCVPESED